jgi:hypothetical protein
MKLRKALLFLPILLIAIVAQASPVGMKVAANESHTSALTRTVSVQAISSFRFSYGVAQPQGFLSSALPSPIPELATLLLFGSGLIGIAAMIRRRSGRSEDAPGKK